MGSLQEVPRSVNTKRERERACVSERECRGASESVSGREGEYNFLKAVEQGLADFGGVAPGNHTGREMADECESEHVFEACA